MIAGIVSNRRPLATLFVRGPGGQGDVEFVIDTGFTGYITLPSAACVALQLPFQGYQPSSLADTTQRMLDIYRLTVLWDGEERQIDVLAIDSAPLIGMSLLDGYEVHIQVTEGGLVVSYLKFYMRRHCWVK